VTFHLGLITQTYMYTYIHVHICTYAIHTYINPCTHMYTINTYRHTHIQTDNPHKRKEHIWVNTKWFEAPFDVIFVTFLRSLADVIVILHEAICAEWLF
jgi:hypothetical protein